MNVVRVAGLTYLGSFFCAMVAAVTLRFLDPFGSGKLVLFQVTYDKVSGAHIWTGKIGVLMADCLNRTGTHTSSSLSFCSESSG